MTASDARPEASDLRRSAESLAVAAAAQETESMEQVTPEELRRMFHELRVHKIELEMQNEELRRVQGDLDTARRRYLDLYDQAPVGYCTLSAEGLIQEANLTAAILLGVPRKELTGLPITSFISREDQDTHYLQLRRLRQTGTPYACDLRMAGKAGPGFWAHLMATATHIPDEGPGPDPQAPVLTRLVLTDITESKRVQAEKVDLEIRLQKAQKAESLGLLAGGIAHDFNNLLGAMLGNLELFRLGQDPEGPGMARLCAVEELISRASLLVAQILAYAGKRTWKPRTLDLNQQTQEVVRLLRATLLRRATLVWRPAAEPLLMAGDPAQIQQVIVNLVLNATEALGPRDGTITVRTGTQDLRAGDLASLPGGQKLRPGPHLWLEVADNGPGIPAAIQERIFDPFFTTRFTGRGLGLSAVRGIVQAHQGAVLLTSQETVGTTFRLLFPAVAEMAQADPAGTPMGEIGAGPDAGGQAEAFCGAGTVLVVDDEDALRAVAVGALRRMGFDTLEARDGLEALGVYEANRARIRLILMDLTMPGMDGVEACRQLRLTGAEAPIILSSGFDPESLASALKAEGFCRFLPKPYRYQALLSTVRAALGQDKAD